MRFRIPAPSVNSVEMEPSLHLNCSEGASPLSLSLSPPARSMRMYSCHPLVWIRAPPARLAVRERVLRTLPSVRISPPPLTTITKPCPPSIAGVGKAHMPGYSHACATCSPQAE